MTASIWCTNIQCELPDERIKRKIERNSNRIKYITSQTTTASFYFVFFFIIISRDSQRYKYRMKKKNRNILPIVNLKRNAKKTTWKENIGRLGFSIHVENWILYSWYVRPTNDDIHKIIKRRYSFNRTRFE